MRRLSGMFFAIWLFVLSALPFGIIYNTQSVSVETDQAALNSLCEAIGLSCKRGDDALRIATYNLLADGVGYYGDRTEQRAKGVIALLECVEADVIGLQEVSRWWFCNLRSRTGYAFIDPLRTELGGFMTAIAYNPNKVELLGYGNIALEMGSNSRLRRVVWGLFRCKGTSAAFMVVNTHFNVMATDNSAGLVQARQLTDIVRELYEEYNCPVIVTGDFNAKKRGAVSYCTSVVYDVLSLKMTDVRNSAESRVYGDGKALSGYSVDHIFSIGQVRSCECNILSQRELCQLSDHYLLYTDIVI